MPSALWVLLPDAVPVLVATPTCIDASDLASVIKRDFYATMPTLHLSVHTFDGQLLHAHELLPHFNGPESPLHIALLEPELSAVQEEPSHLRFYKDVDLARLADIAEPSKQHLVLLQPIPGSQQTRLFVRSIFRSLVTEILAVPTVLVTGPGKSSFLIYLLWTLVWTRHRVLVFFNDDVVLFNPLHGVDAIEVLPPMTDDVFWAMDLYVLHDAASVDLDAIPFGKVHSVRAAQSVISRCALATTLVALPDWDAKEVAMATTTCGVRTAAPLQRFVCDPARSS
ncbi:hypothetical protein SPRG_06194 [Saprolegnia parasitica CBS 223.65]|uniref:Uncharacterized protein n=1 Tax=Saprolegnia parasitica (strain CBS 223.65) TaxID=695850 RepID=A0A067CMW5_SAPPC|nr:hypothetical protein SPRG_06194 [Saprolegnia parasitica CBS 223.65]KDO28147.1 hypothetical protein SPRG_06194 [Saprolegnia parasitica CBS 223.65]|eukprot:XP_012200974.1 hypothetical protein SPRG_06194 [Saprolegnia parasitica CBS 223.65]